MNQVIVSKNRIKREGGVVILSLREYHDLCKKAVPTYYLKGRPAEKLDKLVKNALKAYQQGKTRIIKSLADLG